MFFQYIQTFVKWQQISASRTHHIKHLVQSFLSQKERTNMDKCSIHLLCTHQPRISFVYFDELLCFKKVCSFLTHRPNSTDHSPHLKHVWHQISLFRQTLIATCFQTKITELKVLLFFSTTRHQPGKERLILVSLFAIMAGVYLILLLTFPIHKVLSVFWSISFFRQNVRPV